MFQRFAFILLVSLTIAAVVHRPLFSHAFSSADMIRIAAVEPSADLPSRLITPIETTILGDRSTHWAIAGWLLLGLVAAAWGQIAAGLTPQLSSKERLGSADLWTAIIVVSLPVGFDWIVSPAGHVVLIGTLALALSFQAAMRWPGITTWIILPLAFGAIHRSALSPAFFWVGPCIAWTRGVHRNIMPAVLAAALSTLWWFWDSTMAAANSPLRDSADASLTSATSTLTRALQALFLPSPATESSNWSWSVSICFAASLLILGIAGHFSAKGRGRSAALTGVGLTAIALLGATFQEALPHSLLDGRALITASLGIALGAGVAAAALTRTSIGWIAPLSIVVVLAGTGSLAVRQQAFMRPVAADSTELSALIEQIHPLREDKIADAILIIGTDSVSHPHLSGALVASQSPPFTEASAPRLRTLPGGYNRTSLLAPDGRTLVLDWRPANMASVSTRPKGWVLAPLLLVNAPDGESPVRLLSPAQDAERLLSRPKTLDDDMTFSFEVKSACLRTHDLVFYGAYEGGFNPKGKQQLTARRLSPSVLSAVQKDGWTTIHWRTSIRPGPGQNGIRFEDPDLSLAGKTFHWTVGLIPKDEVCEDNEHHHKEHESHSYTSPTDLAYPRRLHCKRP